MNDTKIKFEKPVFFAQNSGEGSFSATCGSNTRGIYVVKSVCSLKCMDCERTA